MQVTAKADGSNGCDAGVFAASLAFDKQAGRFLIAAVCGDYQLPRVVLAVSGGGGVTGAWNLYSAPADNIPTSWKCPDPTTWGYPDYAQVRLAPFLRPLAGSANPSICTHTHTQHTHTHTHAHAHANNTPAHPAQVGYNADGVFVSWVATCRDGLLPSQYEAGAILYAFPKFAVYTVRWGYVCVCVCVCVCVRVCLFVSVHSRM